MSTEVRQMARHDGVAAADLPVEGTMPPFGGATAWLNSQPLTPGGLRGHVVLVQFWTYTCINWLRTLAYVRAWAHRYRDRGVVVVGVHTPEFEFEHDVENVRRAVKAMDIDWPVAIDNDFEVWRAFGNHYWPALYFVDATGRIRHHRFGEGDFERSEMVIRQLLSEAGVEGMPEGLLAVEGKGSEAQADWSNLGSPETYLGYEQTANFDSAGGAIPDRSHWYTAPARLRLNHWALSGDWIVRGDASRLDTPGGRIAFQFHARDVNLVMGPSARGSSAPFRLLLDQQPARAAHGADVDEHGEGSLAEQRMYQLIRQPQPIVERRFEIEFLHAGAEAFCFTFG